jgi:tetratricopeptide (TPR) repeat protein
MTRFRPWVLALVGAAGLALAAVPAAAQTTPQLPNPEQAPALVEPPKDLPQVQKGDRASNLDRLFAALKGAPDARTAKVIESRIWALWFDSGSDTANLLMNRVRVAVGREDLDLAVRLLSNIIELKPDYAEAWNRRATLFFLRKEYGRAVADIRVVLSLEPRHFGAWSGLAIILEQVGADKDALAAYRHAYELNPHMEKVKDSIDSLIEKVEGRGT